MFLYDFTIIDAPIAEVARALDADASGILREAAVLAGAIDPDRPVVGTRRERAPGWVLPVTWDGSGWPGAIVRLDGELEAAAIDPWHTHLSVSASVERPGPVTQSRVEALQRRHETERVVRAFVTALGGQILSITTA